MPTPFQVTANIVTGSSGTRNYPVANATAAGDTMTALAVVNNTTVAVSSMTDSQGNTWTPDDSFITAAPRVYAYHCDGATGGPGGGPSAALSITDSFTLDTTAASANVELYVTDAGAVGALDNTPAFATGTGTTPSVSATPASSNDTAVSMWGTQFVGGAPTVNSPFTSLGSFSTGSNPYATAAYDVLSGGSDTPLTSTLNITSAGWRGIMWLFKPGSGGVTGTATLAEAGQAWAGSGAAGVSGSGGLAETGDAWAGSGTVTPPPVTGSGGLAEAGQAWAGSGAITPRQLVLALAPAAGTDPYGNAYPAGVTLFGLPLQTESGGVVTAQMTPAGQYAVYNSHGKILGLLAASNGGSGGLFIYADNGATQGALITSMAAAAGTDPITGTAYPAGFTSYETSSPGTHIQVLNQLINFVSGVTGNQIQLGPSAGTGIVPPGLTLYPAGSLTSPPVLASVDPASLASTEKWHQIATGFPAGWSGTFQYKMLPTGAVAVRATFTLSSATVADGTVICTLPAAYQPADLQTLAVGTDALKVNGSTFEAAELRVNAAGQLLCYGIGTAATYINASAIYFLDS